MLERKSHANDKAGGGVDKASSSDELTPTRSTRPELAPIIALVPVEEFRRLGVLPTYYDARNHRLNVICGAAIDDSRRNELSSRLPDIHIEWYQTNQSVFDFVYQRLASEYPSPANDNAAENPAAAHDAGNSEVKQPAEAEQPAPPAPDTNPEPVSESKAPQFQKAVLFITPTGKVGQHLVFAFNAVRCETVTVNSLDQAAVELKQRQVACVFIHENLHGQKNQFIQRMLATNPEIPIRYYRSEAALLMNDTRNQTTFDLFRQNLTLFSRLNDSQGSAIADHAAAVARFTDRMTIRLGIPDHYRLVVTTAAFLHNVAEENLKSTEGLQQTDIIGLSASRLESWGFPQPVVRILRRMYHPTEESAVAVGVETMAGDILTTADVFCHLWPDCSGAGYQTDLVKTKLEGQLRGKVLPKVISALVDIVHDDFTARLLRPNTFSVHIYEPQGSELSELARDLEKSDFGVTSSSNIDDCVWSCSDARTDVVIIRQSGSVQDVYDTLMGLALQGLPLNQLHIALLLDEQVVTDAFRLLSHGVEEILPITAPPRAVVTKLARIRGRLEEQYRHRVSLTERLGTHGSLADMGLTDILESFRGNRRPARLSVTAFGNQLTVYLDGGKIIAADCGESKGTEALLRGIPWRQGIWNIESIEASELPEPNIDQNIDKVLIEACTKLDEAAKDETARVF